MPFISDTDVERRLDELRREPERLQRYDVTGDGVLDEREWELIRRIVTLEIATARERNEEWAVQTEPHVLADRYEVIGLLGRGGQAFTYLARDLEDDDRHVVIKELRLESLEEWKSVELFDREADALQQLDHARIPRYVDAFHVDDDRDVRLMLVQAFVDGEDLGQFVEHGRRWTERQAIERTVELCDILTALHGRSPPLVHRDIKPSNIILGRDDHLHLVDFGAVQTVVPTTVGGSTVVGTSGYVPMEQYMGRTAPASDVYALGATVVHLMTGEHPADLPFRYGRLDFSEHLRVSPPFEDLLRAMLSPHPEDRPADASELRTRLDALRRRDSRDRPTERPTGPTSHDPAARPNPGLPRSVNPAFRNVGAQKYEFRHQQDRVVLQGRRADVPQPLLLVGAIWSLIAGLIAGPAFAIAAVLGAVFGSLRAFLMLGAAAGVCFLFAYLVTRVMRGEFVTIDHQEVATPAGRIPLRDVASVHPVTTGLMIESKRPGESLPVDLPHTTAEQRANFAARLQRFVSGFARESTDDDGDETVLSFDAEQSANEVRPQTERLRR